MEHAILILLHVAGGLFWAGGAVMMGFFIVPSILESGPGGGAVMGGVIARKFPMWMMGMSGILVLTGIRLYMIRFSSAFIASPEGIALTLGALSAIVGLAIGMAVQKPTSEKLGALGAAIKAGGGPPTAEQAAEMKALGAKLAGTARLVGILAGTAALLMAGHRLWAVLGA